MLPRVPAAMPNLARPKNEIVFLFAVATGAFHDVKAALGADDWDPTSPGAWQGLATAVFVGIVQRWFAYGLESAREIQEERDLAQAALRHVERSR